LSNCRARKRGAASQKLSAICAALEYPEVAEPEEQEDEEEDDDEEEDEEMDDEDETEEIEYEGGDESELESSIADGEETMYLALFKSLMNVKDPATGQLLITPFMRLPTRRLGSKICDYLKMFQTCSKV
jgi:hypothetical protein